jgi:hypothetical protein
VRGSPERPGRGRAPRGGRSGSLRRDQGSAPARARSSWFGPDDDLDALEAHVHEVLKLVHGEVPGPVAQVLGDVAGLLVERLCRAARLRTAAVLQGLGQVPV